MILTKRGKVYEIKREILLEKVNVVKKEIDQKLVISYCIVQISLAIDKNTSSHNIIWWDGHEFWSIWKSQKGLCDEPILFHEQNVISICTSYKNGGSQ